MSALVLQAVEQWLDNVVIGLDLCPFAARPRRQQKIRIVTTPSKSPEEILTLLHTELNVLDTSPETETTLIALEHGLHDFFDYNQFLQVCDELLFEQGLEGVYQIASFHPDYQFAGTRADDRENLTNRSPYPLLHIIREASLSKIIDQYPDTDAIPARNIALMESMPDEQVKALFSYLLRR